MLPNHYQAIAKAFMWELGHEPWQFWQAYGVGAIRLTTAMRVCLQVDEWLLTKFKTKGTADD
jgi:hypothetical protein